MFWWEEKQFSSRRDDRRFSQECENLNLFHIVPMLIFVVVEFIEFSHSVIIKYEFFIT